MTGQEEGSAASSRAQRALAWIESLASLPDRGAGTPGEREAAERVADWLRDLGLADTRLIRFPARPHPGVVLAAHGGLAAVALVWGGFLGAVLACLAAASWGRQHRGQATLLGAALPVPDSVNVQARTGAKASCCRVVLSAHIDATRAGLIFSRELADWFARTSRMRAGRSGVNRGPSDLPRMILLAAAVLAVGDWMGAEGLVFGLLGAVVLVLAAVVGLAGLQWANAQPTPGANDNASAVAAMLLCAERLLPDLPDHVELWVVGTGAEEVGLCGMRALLDAHPEWTPDDTWFVNFECVGGGALHWIRSEGTGSKAAYPPTFLELARRLALAGQHGQVTGTDLLAGTDGRIPAERGFPTLSLISLEANGVPRNYHLREDRPEGVDLDTVVRAADFGAAAAAAALRGEAGPWVGE